MDNQLNLKDMESIAENLLNLSRIYVDKLSRIKYPIYDDPSTASIRAFESNHSDLINSLNKVNNLIYNLKKEAGADKKLNVTIKIPTSRYNVQMKVCNSNDEVNSFLSNKNIEFVDLKIGEYCTFYVIYRSIVFDE